MTSTIVATSYRIKNFKNIVKYLSTSTCSSKIKNLNDFQIKSFSTTTTTTLINQRNSNLNLQLREFHKSNVNSNNQTNNNTFQFPPGNPQDKAKLEHLIFIKDQLIHYLPKFFKEMHPYALYTPDVVFENYFYDEPKVTVGAVPYALQLTSIRMKAHLKYGFIKVDLLKVTYDENESSVVIRWRITALSGLKTMLTPWKIKFWKLKDSVKQESEYIDGISTFFIRGDGRIAKHRVERVIKDEDTVKNKNLKLDNLNVNTAL